MTQLRKDPGAISNIFDCYLRGIGPRGSSFTDVDAVTHDEMTHRFLFQEFKGPHEPLNRGQWRVLAGLARKEYITVWCVRLHSERYRLEWCDVGSREHRMLSLQEYQNRFRYWWANQVFPVIETAPTPDRPFDVDHRKYRQERFGDL